MPTRTLRPGNRERNRDAGIVNFSSGQTSHRHWLGSGHRPPPAPRILASVRLGRARDSFSTLGEPTKGFRPHRAPSLRRFGGAGPRCEASSGFGRVDASRSERFFGISSMSGARWRRRASSDACRCSHPRWLPSARRRPVWPARRKSRGCGTELLYVADFSNSAVDTGRERESAGALEPQERTLKGNEAQEG
jgi:hypothetical protein